MANADVLSELDHILADADTESSPWASGRGGGPNHRSRKYEPDFAMLERLLAVPIEQGHAAKQQSGRLAKSLDAYVAYELRRAGFPDSAVFPRARIPRVFPAEFSEVEECLHKLISELTTHEKETGERLKPATVRKELIRLRNALPGSTNAEVLGRFYVKQVDVLVSDWRSGPDVLVSGKSMLSSYRNNLKNRYEEAIGEAYNLRDRYPLAAMGYAYVVRSNIFEEEGAFELLRDLLVRLRRSEGPFDATVLLLADWTSDPLRLIGVDDPASTLSLSRFFEDLLNAVMDNTPVAVHQEIRLRKEGERLGGMPPTEDAARGG